MAQVSGQRAVGEVPIEPDPVAGLLETIGNHRQRTNGALDIFGDSDTAPGTYEVWVRHPSLAADVTRTISVASGQTVTLLDRQCVDW